MIGVTGRLALRVYGADRALLYAYDCLGLICGWPAASCVYGVCIYKMHKFPQFIMQRQLYGIFILEYTCEEDGTVVKDILFISLQLAVVR